MPAEDVLMNGILEDEALNKDKIKEMYGEIDCLLTKLVRNNSANSQFSIDRDSMRTQILNKLNDLKAILARNAT